MLLQGLGHEDLHRIRNSSMVLHNIELNGGVRLLYKYLELPVCPDVFHQPL